MRTSYPRFKRLFTAHEPRLFFSPRTSPGRDAADAPGLRDYSLVTRLVLLVCVRDGG
ncbi:MULTISPECIES: hypothetical protein [Streptomyces]|uniref:Transposase n=1 Tax=Streptomyces ramulosus TaxID=47762 RepID=A0ABW1FQL4_9ACTN